MGLLEGKVAIVTGGGQGIGKGISLAFAKQGAKVVVAELNPTSCEAAAKEIRDLGKEAIGLVCDVGSRESINKTVAETVKKYGTVDIVVNNALGFTHAAPVELLTDKDFDITIQTGIKGVFYFSQAVFPLMKDRGGSIINIGSGQGIMGVPGTAVGSCVKEGVRGFSRVCAREWGKYKIRINVINPFAETPTSKTIIDQLPPEVQLKAKSSNPLMRIGDPEKDIGSAAVFLASDLACFVTGQTICVDGGNCML